MKINLLLSFFLLSCTIGFSQFTLNTSNFSVSTSGGSSTISVGGNLDFSNSITNGNALLVLSGINDQIISTSTQRSLSDVAITGGGTKTFSGDFVISQSITLQEGLIQTSGIFNIASSASIVEPNEGASFILGTLYRDHPSDIGILKYPIGNGGTYTPVFVDADGTNPIVGITALNSKASVDALPKVIPEYSDAWSWQLNAVDNANFAIAFVTLPFLADDKGQFGVDGYRPVVLHNEDGQSTASLQNANGTASSASTEVRALDAGGIGTYFVGKEVLNDPRINNVITPNEDGINDFLTIQNLSLFPKNSVVLIDKYGTVVFQSEDYISPLADSAPGDGKNFDFLAAGNYFCILKYTDPQTNEEFKLSKTVTVLY